MTAKILDTELLFDLKVKETIDLLKNPAILSSENIARLIALNHSKDSFAASSVIFLTGFVYLTLTEKCIDNIYSYIMLILTTQLSTVCCYWQ